MSTNKVLVILGMHRSGTSLITRWLQACGLPVGDELLGPETGNDEGHFEDMDFIHLHEQLLFSQKMPHTGLTGTIVTSLSPEGEITIRNLITLKNQRHIQWGWKDPRTCLFLDSYRKLLPDAYYLIILRDYQSVVSSLLNRDYKGLQRYYLSKGRLYQFFLRLKNKYNKTWLYNTHTKKYLKVWIAYNEELLKHIETIHPDNYLVTNYHTLLNNDAPVFSRLKNWGFALQHHDFKTLYNRQLIGQPVNIAALINDVALLAKANQLETKLQNTLQNIRQS